MSSISPIGVIGSELNQLRARQLNVDIPTWEGVVRNPLFIPEVIRADIQTFGCLASRGESLPDPAKKYIRRMFDWIKVNPGVLSPWMVDFYNVMAGRTTSLRPAINHDPWYMKPRAIENYFTDILLEKEPRLAGTAATYKMLRSQEYERRQQEKTRNQQ